MQTSQNGLSQNGLLHQLLSGIIVAVLTYLLSVLVPGGVVAQVLSGAVHNNPLLLPVIIVVLSVDTNFVKHLLDGFTRPPTAKTP